MEDSIWRVIGGTIITVITGLTGWNIKKVDDVKNEIQDVKNGYVKKDDFYRSINELKAEHQTTKIEIMDEFKWLRSKIDRQ